MNLKVHRRNLSHSHFQPKIEELNFSKGFEDFTFSYWNQFHNNFISVRQIWGFRDGKGKLGEERENGNDSMVRISLW